MFNSKSLDCGRHRSEIRELFEYGKTLKLKGETVYDFTLGNPSPQTPSWVTQALKQGLDLSDIHAYTSAQGSLKARSVIAERLSIGKKAPFSADFPMNQKTVFLKKIKNKLNK